ncbi:glycoside hydrolase family 172 protein [Thermopirellula anaerolimosa]
MHPWQLQWKVFSAWFGRCPLWACVVAATTATVAVVNAVALAEETSTPSPTIHESAQIGEAASSSDPFSGLQFGAMLRPLPGRSGRISSAAPRRSSNFDNRFIGPGQTLVLAEIAGPAVIQHIWLTFPGPEPGWLGKDGNADHSELVLRMYWDGAEDPAVESPVGDFFAAGFGKRAAVNSAPITVEGGDAYNCWWPMPFFRSARIEITNESRKPLNAFYYQIDFTRFASLPDDTLYFCAQYRQEFPVESGRDYLILDAEGRGQYVGTVLSVRSRSPEWFGEGDEKFYIDGETRPSIQGTGTEDYALNAWGMGTGTYPYFGVSILDGEWGMVGYRTTVYRWHIPDAVRFSRSLRVEIEDAGWISEDELAPNVHRGFVERNDDFATVAFWYQQGQPKRFARLPTAAERKLPELDRITEGKELIAAAKAEGGTLHLQKGYPWTGDGQLFFDNPTGKGAWFSCTFHVTEEELTQLTLRVTYSYDFGIYRIMLDDEEVRSREDFFSPEVEVRELNLGQRRLAIGEHTLRFECLGKSQDSRGTKLGVDSVRLRKRWQKQRTAPQDFEPMP